MNGPEHTHTHTHTHTHRVLETWIGVPLSVQLSIKLYVGRMRLYRARKVNFWLKNNYWGAVN